jgi:uncharacterized FlaG/YvyC family protein
MDVHNIHGEITSLKQGLHKLEEKVDSHYQQLNEWLDNIQLDIDFAVHKTTENEREIYKIKKQAVLKFLLKRRSKHECHI